VVHEFKDRHANTLPLRHFYIAAYALHITSDHMIQRPLWVDIALAICVALLMLWVAYGMITTEGLIPGLMYPVFFGTVPLLFIFCLKLPLEAFLLFLIWLLAALGFGSGLLEGVTFFPSKNGSNDISIVDSPIAFGIAMTVDFAVVIAGFYMVFRWWRGRQSR
jgi:hypothetical protein